jgi:hypothetical protein
VTPEGGGMIAAPFNIFNAFNAFNCRRSKTRPALSRRVGTARHVRWALPALRD